MSRRPLTLYPPYREIMSSDGKKEFWNRLTPKNQIDLSYLAGINTSNRYVIVYDMDDQILGFMTFLDEGDHLHLDLIERNELLEESHNAGFNLMILLEAIAASFAYSRISLYSTVENVRYYQRLDYVVSGESFDNIDYGRLTPMEKILGRHF